MARELIRGRQVILVLTNKSGGSVAVGDVVILSSGTASAFTTTTSAGQTDDLVGVAIDTIANDAEGRICIQGYVPVINLSSSASLGDYVATHTVAKQAARSGTLADGAFGQVLGTGTTPEAVIWGKPHVGGGSTYSEGVGIIIDSNTLIGILGYPCQGRLTLTTGTPVTTADVTAATTLYFTPYNGDHICLYDGSGWKAFEFTELSLSLSGYTADKNYDIWAYDNSGTVTLDSTIWTDNTTRATALAKQNGIYVKTGATERRYLGTIRITGTTGQCEDSLTKRYVWNYYNRVERKLLVRDTTTDWTYDSNTWRQANNATGNKVESVIGVSEDMIWLEYANRVVCNNTSGLSGIGINKTNGNDCDVMGYFRGPSSSGANQSTARGKLTLYPAVGYSYYAAVERTESGSVGFNSNAAVGYTAALMGSQMG